MVMPQGESATVKVAVHKGRTFSLKQYESLRLDYSVEDTVPRGEAETALATWEKKLDEMLATHAPQPAILETAPASIINPSEPSHASAPALAADPYSTLSWKQSARKPNLSTIQVTSQLPPLAAKLYCILKNGALKTQSATYRLSKTNNGLEFLQRWSRGA